MFICKLCDGKLSSLENILGTYCGHIFHKKCLDQHLIYRSPNCPSCEKFLRVEIQCISSGYAVLPLHPEERIQDETLPPENCVSPTSRKIDASQENLMLKEKLVEVIQGLIVMQKELKFKNQSNSSFVPEHEDIPNVAFANRKGNYKTEAETPHHHKSNKSITDMIVSNLLQSSEEINDNDGSDDEHEDSHRDEGYANNSNLMGSELVILRDKSMIGKGLTEEEKNRIIRSKRREYLTWRNKAQSWLSKMEVASKRLIQSEEAFTQEDYLQQLSLFFNKIYNQGGIIEEAKQAAAVYLIIDDIPEVEMKEIHEKVRYLTETHSAIMTVILNKINSLKAEMAAFDEEPELTNNFERNYSLESEGDDDDQETVIERNVPHNPRQTDNKSFKGKVTLQISGLSDTESTYSTPVFV